MPDSSEPEIHVALLVLPVLLILLGGVVGFILAT